MKFERTDYQNLKIVVNDDGVPVAVQIDGVVKFEVGDVVKVRADRNGYICPEIKEPGIGQITDISKEHNDQFFGVKMATSREFGHVSVNQISHFPFDK